MAVPCFAPTAFRQGPGSRTAFVFRRSRPRRLGRGTACRAPTGPREGPASSGCPCRSILCCSENRRAREVPASPRRGEAWNCHASPLRRSGRGLRRGRPTSPRRPGRHAPVARLWDEVPRPFGREPACFALRRAATRCFAPTAPREGPASCSHRMAPAGRTNRPAALRIAPILESTPQRRGPCRSMPKSNKSRSTTRRCCWPCPTSSEWASDEDRAGPSRQSPVPGSARPAQTSAGRPGSRGARSRRARRRPDRRGRSW